MNEIRREEELFIEKEILRDASSTLGNGNVVAVAGLKSPPCASDIKLEMQLGEKSGTATRKRERVSRCGNGNGVDSLAKIGLQETSTSMSGHSHSHSSTCSSSNGVKKARKESTYEDFIVEIPESAKEGEVMHVSLSPSSQQSVAFKVPPSGQTLEDNDIDMDMSTTCRRVKIRIPKDFCKDGKWLTASRRMSPNAISSPCRKRRSGRVKEIERMNRIKAFDDAAMNYNIGPSHQIPISDLPVALNYDHDIFMSENPERSNSNGDEYYEQIWDPNKGGASDQSATEIENILANLPTNHKEIMMESLHKNNYDTYAAFETYLEKIRLLKSNGDLPGEPLAKEEAEFFKNAIFEQSKDLGEAIAETKNNGSKQSASSLLVHYYRCVKTSSDYPRLKEIVAKLASDCVVCHDGGTLICCDRCDDAYHLDCLDPPLKQVPEGNWYCPKCIDKPNAAKMF